MKASILAIGTELTTGQIINKNAALLSEKLKNMGLIVTTHLTVPDEKNIILNSLEFLENHSELIFVTGGLGPTSDDFTRDVLAQWAETKMNFDESSWLRIVERLSSRGFKVREMQRQQCFFPENSKILLNSEGTANAFKFEVKKDSGIKIVYALPGPPREIEAIWAEHIQSDLNTLTQNFNKLVTKSWDTLGVGESEVAFHVEDVLKDRPFHTNLEIGYRVHLPYVEVKLSYSEKDHLIWKPWIEKIDKTLNTICISRDFNDVAAIAADKIKDLDFTFYDFISDGFLHTRLSPYLTKIKKWSFKQSTEAPDLDLFENEDNFLALLPYEDNKCLLAYSRNGRRHQKNIEAPMKSPLLKERQKQYFVEIALVELASTIADPI